MQGLSSCRRPGKFVRRHHRKEPAQVGANIQDMQLQQTVGLLREALRYGLRDALMVRDGDIQPLRMLKLHPPVGSDALAGAEGQS